MHFLISIFLSLVMIIGGTVSSAYASSIDDLIDRFRLWNNCQPIRLLVEELSDDAKEIGLTNDAIEVAVRSRLRGARLFTESRLSKSDLYINVTVAGRAGSIRVDFRKELRDMSLGEDPVWSHIGQSFSAITWSTAGVGTYGKNANYILGIVSQYTDKFIDEYLRVNAGSCK